MSRYKNLVQTRFNQNKNRLIVESSLYSDDIKERMHPMLEEDLLNNKTSLSNNPCFPTTLENDFLTKLVGERFKSVVNSVKSAFSLDEVDSNQIIKEMMPLVISTMELESKHIKELEELAVKMIKEEFDIDEEVDLIAELTPYIEDANPNEEPSDDLLEFDNHDEIEYAGDSVYKRRFINAMNQGAAKKVNHIYHMVDDELANINPKLLSNYKKMMSAADYTYFLYPDLKSSTNGGSCSVDFPKDDKQKVKVNAKAMVFPVLVHELYKGCMEVLSSNGLPTKKNIAEYVINKADYLNAEPWDMRIGPGLWGKFCSMIPSKDFNLKHYVYVDLVKLEPEEFKQTMREILAGTNEGKTIISKMLDEIKADLKNDAYNQAMDDNGLFEIDDLI